MKSLDAVKSLKGKTVLIRVDYNVPIEKGRIVDARRVVCSYKTVDAVLEKGGIPILVTHQGDGAQSLLPIAKYLGKRYKILFLSGPLEGANRKWIVEHAAKGVVILLQNIRRYPGEEKNDPKLARLLAKLADVYVNDAFPVSHRAHASIVGVPKLLPSYVGYQFMAEIAALSHVLASKAHPFLFILGGAKFSTKIPIIDRFLARTDEIVIAGAILNDFYKVAGFEVGASVVEGGYDTAIRKFLKEPKFLLPTNVIVERGSKTATIAMDDVKKGDRIVDIGPASIALIISKIKKAKLVVWNGPTGWYEKGFDKGTKALARALVVSKARVIIGGGDTEAVIEAELKKVGRKKNIFISTGGGAALEYLASRTLAGLRALSGKQVAKKRRKE